MITEADAKREGLEPPKPDGDGDEEDGFTQRITQILRRFSADDSMAPRYPQVLRANNSTIAELKSIDIWWHGLTSSQRRSMLCKDILVSRTEYILNLEIAYVSQLAFKQDRRIASGDNDDDDAAKEKKKENDPTKTQSSGATKST